MTEVPATPLAALLRRAASERDAHKPYLAYRLYRHVAEVSRDGAERLLALERALDLCLAYFAKDSDESLATASELCELTERRDGRALVALGVGRSLRSRRLWQPPDTRAAWDEARRAEECLKAATQLLEFDTDAWGSLGGLYKRMASWSEHGEDLAGQARYQEAMLAAYQSGMERGVDPYPTLNFLEYRAVFARALPIVTEQECSRLQLALDVRKNQFARAEDAPWAAFDIARGQHYLKPNVPRFLNDLGVAIEDARSVARRASDRWMVETAVTALRDLYNAGVPVDGLEEALLLCRQAVVDDAWVAGNWGALGKPEEFLVTELRAARAELEALAQLTRNAHGQLSRHIQQAELRWSEADEQRFNEELAKFRREVEPGHKKQVRVLWKLFGEKALTWGLGAGAAFLVPGAAAASVASVVGAYAAHLISEQAS